MYFQVRKLLCLLLLSLSTVTNSQYTATSIVGNSGSTRAITGNFANTTSLGGANSAWKNTVGELFLTEKEQVLKIGLNGVVEVLVPHTSGFSPYGIQGNTAGVIYFAEAKSNQLRTINTSTNTVTDFSSVVGNFSLLQVTSIFNQMIVVASPNAHVAYQILSTDGTYAPAVGNGVAGSIGDGLRATAASINQPGSIFLDSTVEGYITETIGRRIRKVDNTGIISTYVGNGTPSLTDGPRTAATVSEPYAITGDTVGRLYFVDMVSTSGHVRLIDLNDTVTTILGGGTDTSFLDDTPGTDLSLSSIGGLWVDSVGILYVGTKSLNRILQVTYTGPTTFASTALPTSSPTGPTTLPTLLPTALPTFLPTMLPTVLPSPWVNHTGAYSEDGPLSHTINQYEEKFFAGFTRTYANGSLNGQDWDAYVRKFKPSSHVQDWKLHLGGPGDDLAYSVTTDSEGSAYVCGKTSQSLPGFTSAGGTDSFISKLDRDGLELWHVQWGTSDDDRCVKVRITASGNSVIAEGNEGLRGYKVSYSTDGVGNL